MIFLSACVYIRSYSYLPATSFTTELWQLNSNGIYCLIYVPASSPCLLCFGIYSCGSLKMHEEKTKMSTPASAGGRFVYALIPSWLQRQSDYPTHSSGGSPSYIWIIGNMAGSDAGCILEASYDRHLFEVQGMTRSIDFFLN